MIGNWQGLEAKEAGWEMKYLVVYVCYIECSPILPA